VKNSKGPDPPFADGWPRFASRFWTLTWVHRSIIDGPISIRRLGVVEIESEWTARDRERGANGGGERIFLYPG